MSPTSPTADHLRSLGVIVCGARIAEDGDEALEACSDVADIVIGNDPLESAEQIAQSPRLIGSRSLCSLDAELARLMSDLETALVAENGL